jgi:6-phosphogluconate dehydrogenase
MADVKMEFGVVGLGRMGANLSLQALEKDMRVVGYDLKGVSDELKKSGMVEVNSLDGFRDKLSPARPLFIYIPAGPTRTLMKECTRFGL